MRVEPKSLVRRLTPSATQMLEAAVSRANGANHSEILVEHFLAAMLDIDDGDAARILAHYSSDITHLKGRVERVLASLRSQHSGRPTFSQSLFQWMEDAWLLASVELGDVRLRSGALLLQFIARTDRYTAETYPELERISTDDLKRMLDDIVGPSPETVEAVPTQEGGTPVRAAGKEGIEALERFTVSFNEQAKTSLDPIFGRESEIRQMVDVLARRRKNNPIIVGEPGVGKTALVEGLARLIVDGQVPPTIAGVEIRGLDLGLLQAGAGVKGEFENRLKSVIAAVKASPTPIVLFIDEAHTLIGAGGPSGGSDAANLLKPALARGELRTIAATTWTEYKEHFEKDPALERRFQVVKVEPPSIESATLMLRGLRASYENTHDVIIRDEAVVAAVELSDRYISGRQLPDKAVDLLDTAAARVRVALDAIPEVISLKEAELAGLERAETALTRDANDGEPIDQEKLDEITAEIAAVKDALGGLKARWEEERGSVKAVLEARKAKAEAAEDLDDEGRAALETALSEAVAKYRTLLESIEDPLVHADVTGQAVAQVVANWTGIPVGKMQRDNLATLLQLEERLQGRVRGQDHALTTISDTLRTAQAGIRDPRTPVGVFLFVGPSGVGKTETAVALADVLFGGERFMTTINMSEFQEKHTVSRLIGSPPGYVGYGKGGVLTEAVRQRPYSVVLLDECEKADLEVMNLFYQVFDKGALMDGTGRDIDFRNTVIILTSNLASEDVMQMYEADEPPSVENVAQRIRPKLSAHFKPALLARMTLIPYRPIDASIMKDIAQMKLNSLAGRLQTNHGIETKFAPELLDELARRCTEAEVGARNVDHVLRRSLMPELSRALLEVFSEGEAPRAVEVGLSPDGGWRVDFED